jgi:hypothetical protein
MRIEFRQLIAGDNNPPEFAQRSEQPHERSRRLEHHAGPGRHLRHIAAELQRITEALLGVQQNDTVADRLPAPQRHREIPSEPRTVYLRAPLIFSPSFCQPPGQQKRKTQVVVRLGIIRP